MANGNVSNDGNKRQKGAAVATEKGQSIDRSRRFNDLTANKDKRQHHTCDTHGEANGTAGHSLAALLAAKASATEAEEYRQWALSIAEKVANAATEGGFLGFGGERVTPAEKSLIDDIRKALGTNAAA